MKIKTKKLKHDIRYKTTETTLTFGLTYLAFLIVIGGAVLAWNSQTIQEVFGPLIFGVCFGLMFISHSAVEFLVKYTDLFDDEDNKE